jgi:mRNA interferase MazF
VVSHDVFNEHSGTVIALALTSRPPKAGFPLTFELNIPSLPKKSWVKISQVRTLSTERIGARLARVPSEDMAQILEGFNEIIND